VISVLPCGLPLGGVQQQQATAAPSARACQRGKWSSWAGLTLRFTGDHRCQAPSQLRPHRPCPPRARSTGIWRSLTVNSGRSLAALTCAIGVASGVERLPGRAFQARDRWGHIGATNDRIAADNSGPASSQLTGHIRPDSAGRRKRPSLPDTDENRARVWSACCGRPGRSGQLALLRQSRLVPHFRDE
jgi:hypothetical protein